jgi:hypothetical protein
MRKFAISIIIGVTVLLGVLLFVQERSKKQGEPSTAMQTSPGHEGHDHATGETMVAGKVIETMNSGGYTYVEVNANGEKVWAAGPETPIKVGDTVAFTPGMEMANFRSETLDRTFEVIHFVSELRTGGGASTSQLPEGHPQPTSSAFDARDVDFSGLEIPKGGKSIADLYAGKAGLGGKKVAIRGKVVKFTAGVMDKNWIHLQDGTGAEGTNDLTVTTDAVVNVGDVVLVQGKLAVDKDFGFGYTYDIIVENATVTVE